MTDLGLKHFPPALGSTSSESGIVIMFASFPIFSPGQQSVQRHYGEGSGKLCGSLWEPLGASGSLWEPLGASGSLWEPLGASGSSCRLLCGI